MNDDLISRSALEEKAETVTLWNGDVRRFVSYETIDNAQPVERPQGDFTIDELRKWLYEIAFNNSDNEFGGDCLEIIDRLDGFERFVAAIRDKEKEE